MSSRRPGASQHDALRRSLEAGRVIPADHPPLNVQLQTTSACNGRCVFCPHPESWQREHPGVMAEPLFRRIIRQLEGRRVGKLLPYLENEPLCDPDIFARLDHALARLDPTMLNLATNAALLDAAHLDDLARVCRGVKHELWISFHGADRESYEAITGLPFARTLDNVVALMDRAQTDDLNLRIRGAGQPRLDDDDLPRWFDEASYRAFWDGIFARHRFRRLPVVEFFSYHDRAGNVRRNQASFGDRVRRDLTGAYCMRVDCWLHFLYTGELILCCMDYRKETVLGDASRQDLDQIFASPTYLELARRAAGLEEAEEEFICRRCCSPGG